MPCNRVKLDLCFCPSSVASVRDLHSCAVVIIDVLRASATLCALVEQHPEQLKIAADIESARILCASDPHLPSACIGERGGLAPEGFLCGNSPTEIRQVSLDAYHVYYATTNGTRMASLTQNAAVQLVGSFGNIDVLMDSLQRVCTEMSLDSILLCCSGNDGAFSLEDSFFAGAFIQRYIAGSESLVLTDAAEAALCIAKAYNFDSQCMISHARHARLLHAMGFTHDVAFCVEENRFATVPLCRGSVVSAFR